MFFLVLFSWRTNFWGVFNLWRPLYLSAFQCEGYFLEQAFTGAGPHGPFQIEGRPHVFNMYLVKIDMDALNCYGWKSLVSAYLLWMIPTSTTSEFFFKNTQTHTPNPKPYLGCPCSFPFQVTWEKLNFTWTLKHPYETYYIPEFRPSSLH
jgi:hypothetical protein